MIRVKLGYARVSSDTQKLEPQIEQLVSVGCSRVFKEKLSGATRARPQLTKALSLLRPGDTLVVCRLDRLARSSRDLLDILHVLSSAGVLFVSMADPWADTTTPHGRLMLSFLGGLAEFERSLIAARTSEGRRRAREAGVRFGRRCKLTPFQKREAVARRESGETLKSIARSYNVSHCTISRLMSRSVAVSDAAIQFRAPCCLA